MRQMRGEISGSWIMPAGECWARRLALGRSGCVLTDGLWAPGVAPPGQLCCPLWGSDVLSVLAMPCVMPVWAVLTRAMTGTNGDDRLAGELRDRLIGEGVRRRREPARASAGWRGGGSPDGSRLWSAWNAAGRHVRPCRAGRSRQPVEPSCSWRQRRRERPMAVPASHVSAVLSRLTRTYPRARVGVRARTPVTPRRSPAAVTSIVSSKARSCCCNTSGNGALMPLHAPSPVVEPDHGPLCREPGRRSHTL